MLAIICFKKPPKPKGILDEATLYRDDMMDLYVSRNRDEAVKEMMEIGVMLTLKIQE